MFAALIRAHRRAAGLTQEDLAERAGMSVRAVGNLERGKVRTAQRRSATQLADALGLTGAVREEFLENARGRRTVAAAPPYPHAELLCPLPLDLPTLFGREKELAELAAATADSGGGPSLSVIVGAPGVGKTSLAVHAVHRLRANFPDGCLVVDMRGMDSEPLTPRMALDRLLRALGVPAGEIPAELTEQGNLLRVVLKDQRILLLLDNVADEAQVRPILLPGLRSHTVITCRQALAGLDDVRRIRLDPLRESASVSMLESIVGTARVAAERAATAELVSLCGNLPLAVRISANRLLSRPQWSIGYLVGQLRDERARLNTLAAGDLAVRPVLDLSYRRLTPALQHVFRSLGAVPGSDFDAEIAAVATGLPVAEVGAALDELADMSLLQLGTVAGRYQFHDLLRLYARERMADEPPAGGPAAQRPDVVGYLVRTAVECGRMFWAGLDAVASTERFPSSTDAGAWLDKEAANWLSAQEECARTGRHAEVVELARALHWYSDTCVRQRPWHSVFALGVESARALGDRRSEAELLHFVAWAESCCLGRISYATARAALDATEAVGDRLGHAWAVSYMAQYLQQEGELETAVEEAARAVGLAEGLGFWGIEGTLRNRWGTALLAAGRAVDALERYESTLADIAARRAETNSWNHNLFLGITLRCAGRAQVALGRHREAAVSFCGAADQFRAEDAGTDLAEVLLLAGRALRQANDHRAAEGRLRCALAAINGPASYRLRADVQAELAAIGTT